MKQILKKILPTRLYTFVKKVHFIFRKDLTYASDGLYTCHNSDFSKDPRFKEAYEIALKVDGGQLIGENYIGWRLHVLYTLGSYVKNLEGDFVDCGVNTGFCARSLMHYIGFDKLDKKYFLLDTFYGMDSNYSDEYEMNRNKTHHYEDQKGNFEKVKATFSKYGDKVNIIKGAVPDTLSSVQSEKICLLHLDMNSAVPEVAALEFFWPKMVKGGIVLFDDYAYVGYHTQKKAHDVWAKNNGVEILSLPTGQGLLIKG